MTNQENLQELIDEFNKTIDHIKSIKDEDDKMHAIGLLQEILNPLYMVYRDCSYMDRWKQK